MVKCDGYSVVTHVFVGVSLVVEGVVRCLLCRVGCLVFGLWESGALQCDDAGMLHGSGDLVGASGWAECLAVESD